MDSNTRLAATKGSIGESRVGGHMLTQFLPGLRDLRAPLSAGALWLTALALAIIDKIPTTSADASQQTKPLYQLVSALGITGTLGAAAFAAYLLGIVTM